VSGSDFAAGWSAGSFGVALGLEVVVDQTLKKVPRPVPGVTLVEEDDLGYKAAAVMSGMVLGS
jgi:hypothetical protein